MDIDAFLEGGFEVLADARPEKASGAQQPLPASLQGTASTADMPDLTHSAQQSVEGKLKKKKKKKKDKVQQGEAGVGHEDDGEQPSKEEAKRTGPAAVQRELKSHRAELEALKESDPSFYEYLQQSDKSLLDFDSDGSGDDYDDDKDESEEDAPDQHGKVDGKASSSSSKAKADKASAQRASQQVNAPDDEHPAQPRGVRLLCVTRTPVM